MTVIDRGLGQTIPAGNWEAVFYQATHDAGGLDVGFASNWPHLTPVRGAYHFARPTASSGVAQANLFINRVQLHGWNAAKDLWMLDVEATGPNLAQWINDFMGACRVALGDRGFLYIGWPFFCSNVSTNDFSVLHQYRWWLPDYGPDDGNDHGLPAGLPVTPVLHQYASVPFDKSNVTDRARWLALFKTSPPPPPPDVPDPTTTTFDEAQMKQTDTTVVLGTNGCGYFDLPGVSDQAVHAWGVIGVPDPQKGWGPVSIPNVAFTLAAASHEDRFAIKGGNPGAAVTVRVVHD